MTADPTNTSPRRIPRWALSLAAAWIILAASMLVLVKASAWPPFGASGSRETPTDPGADTPWQSLAAEAAKRSSSLALSSNETPTATTDPVLVSTDLVRLFAAFDANADGVLQVREAGSFYAWVSKHIQYRYDDENGGTHQSPYRAGDGRPGVDYWQTPRETFDEAMGDCEDQGLLAIAFYHYWNIPAFLALVNVLSDKVADHAVAVVRAADTEEQLFAAFGPVPYYNFIRRDGVPDGLYVIIDNTYSQSFGDVSGGIEPGHFEVFRVLAYPGVFAAETPMRPVLPGP